MLDTDLIIKRIAAAADTAAQLLSLSDRAAGLVGRGGPRWHRWKALRLRLRATRIEVRRPTKARMLRTLAAIHLAHALRHEADITTADERQFAALVAGIEPEAQVSPRRSHPSSPASPWSAGS